MVSGNQKVKTPTGWNKTQGAWVKTGPNNWKAVDQIYIKEPGGWNNASGQEVRAVRKGEVVYSGDRMASYGKMIIIKHAYGFYSIYNQNQELLVSEGDSIEKGELIAITGDKPFYFEMKKYEEPINPLKYL